MAIQRPVPLDSHAPSGRHDGSSRPQWSGGNPPHTPERRTPTSRHRGLATDHRLSGSAPRSRAAPHPRSFMKFRLRWKRTLSAETWRRLLGRASQRGHAGDELSRLLVSRVAAALGELLDTFGMDFDRLARMRRLARAGKLLLHSGRSSMPAQGRPSPVEHLLLHQDADEKIGGRMPLRAHLARHPGVEECQHPIAGPLLRSRGTARRVRGSAPS